MRKIATAAGLTFALTLSASAPEGVGLPPAAPSEATYWHVGEAAWAGRDTDAACMMQRGGALSYLEPDSGLVYTRRDPATTAGSECQTGEVVPVAREEADAQERAYRRLAGELGDIVMSGAGSSPAYSVERWQRPIATGPENAFQSSGEGCIPAPGATNLVLGALSTGEQVVYSQAPPAPEIPLSEVYCVDPVVFLVGAGGRSSY